MFDVHEAPVCQPDFNGEEQDDREFTREEWLAWYESEFAGYQQERDDQLVTDDAGETQERELLFAAGFTSDEVERWQPGPVRVPKHLLEQDRETLHHLGRSGGNGTRWLRLGAEAEKRLGRKWIQVKTEGRRRDSEMYRVGPNDERVVVGAHPFSKAEGSAEWLQRARIEMRFLWRNAGSDAERKAIVSREASLRARHNARCYAREIASYFRLDEAEVLAVLDRRQKDEPIGWLGLEASMRAIHGSLFDDYLARRDAWDAEFRASWSQEQKDEWLDRMPEPPLHPTELVTSVKKIRPYDEVKLEQSLPEVTASKAALLRAQGREARRRRRLSKVVEQTPRVQLELPERGPDADWWVALQEWKAAGRDIPVRPSPSQLRRERLEAAGATDEVIAAFYAERRRLRASA